MVLAVLSLLLAGSAGAQTGKGVAPGTTIQCIRVDGTEAPPLCDVPGSKIDKSEYLCTCRDGQRIAVPICGPGERRPPESVALHKVRRELSRDGSLVGDRFEGRPICLDPRRP
jgi:hypothetical protein